MSVEMITHSVVCWERLAETRRHLQGVTQRMLPHTLRHLEQDGLISRHDFREMPLRVQYSLTELRIGLWCR
jgi:DNA-binding HxlR family transcriptional regulator